MIAKFILFSLSLFTTFLQVGALHQASIRPAEAFEYIHDPAGNRVTAIGPDRTAHWQPDATNQLQSQTGLGPRRIEGTVDEPSHVKVNGDFVPVDENLRFEGFMDTFVSRNVTIEATDAAENTTIKTYRFPEPDNMSGLVMRHDANGRLIEIERGEETTTYTWDALDRLIEAETISRDGITGKTRTYSYDPLSRLSRIDTESWNENPWIVQSGEVYIYAGLDRLQKRNSTNTTTIRSYYEDGFIDLNGTRYYYGRDHLGSITELIHATTGEVVSRREYSPYGEILSQSGTVFADFAFTGHFYDSTFKLHHAPARVYDAALGRIAQIKRQIEETSSDYDRENRRNVWPSWPAEWRLSTWARRPRPK